MPIVQESVNVLKDTREVGKLLTKLVSEIKAAIATNRPLVEVVQVGNAILSDLVPAVTRIPAVKADEQADLPDFATTAFLFGKETLEALLS